MFTKMMRSMMLFRGDGECEGNHNYGEEASLVCKILITTKGMLSTTVLRYVLFNKAI